MNEELTDEECAAWDRLFAQWKNGGTAETLELAKQYLARWPKRPGALIVLADCLTTFSRYSEALAALRSAERLLPPERWDQVWHYRGQVFRRKGSLATAEKWLRRAAEAQPRDANHWVFLGSLLSRRGNLDEALDCHRRAAKLGTGAKEEACFNVGGVLCAMGKYQQALTWVEKAIHIDPSDRKYLRLAEDLKRTLRARARPSA